MGLKRNLRAVFFNVKAPFTHEGLLVAKAMRYGAHIFQNKSPCHYFPNTDRGAHKAGCWHAYNMCSNKEDNKTLSTEFSVA